MRTNLPEPVITLQAETDVLRSIAIRQGDSHSFRMWEVAGTGHSDIYTTLKSGDDKGDDPMVADVIAEAGFLRSADAELIKARARTSGLGG